MAWVYYNHAMISDLPPHLEEDVSAITNGGIWKAGGALLARWTSDFDCGYETNWWYIVKDAPYEFEGLSKSTRKHIRHALKNNICYKIDPSQYEDEIWDCYCLAHSKYVGADNYESHDKFKRNLEESSLDYWGCFDIQEQKLVGYMVVKAHTEHVDLQSAKFSPHYLNKGVSYALYHTILSYYLNDCGYKYINSGSRSINHATNTEEYKIHTFNYRRAYCKLHIVYRPGVNIIVKMIYPFRRVISLLPQKALVRQVLGILKMEEIRRGK